MSTSKKNLLQKLSTFFLPPARYHPLILTILVALLSAGLLSIGQWNPKVIPFGDGRAFAQQAIELHGLLHTGQWEAFQKLLFSPSTSTFLPTYFLFLLLPSVMATGPIYGFLNCLVWNLMLAIGIYGVLAVLSRPHLAPAVMLLSVANNYALDASYYYHMDLAFMGWAMVVIWLQALAIKKDRPIFSILFGVMLGALFLIKAGNAFVLLFFVGLAEMLNTGSLNFPRERQFRASLLLQILGRWVGVLAGFMPLFLLSYFFGSIQIIVVRIVAGQISFSRTPPSDSPLLRIFFFPLCLGYFYSVLLMISAFCILFFTCRNKKSPCSDKKMLKGKDFWILMSLVSSYLLAWGIFFSFVMTAKVIRLLLPMLPIMWIALFSLPPLHRLLAKYISCFAAIFFCFAHFQAFTGLFQKTNRDTEGYCLVDDWWNRLPGKKDLSNLGPTLTEGIKSALLNMGVGSGKIGVGSEMLYWNSCSLNWIDQIPDLRKGVSPSRHYVTVCDNKGFPIRRSWEGLNALVLVVHSRVQYSQKVFQFNVNLTNYAIKNWRGKEAKDIRIFSDSTGTPVWVGIVFKEPFSKVSLERMMKEVSPNGFSTFSEMEENLSERRLDLKECYQVLMDHIQ